MYAELHCHSAFSLLDGASLPEALVARAQVLGLHALALTDHDSLAGVVRFWSAARSAGQHAILGAEVTLAPHPALGAPNAPPQHLTLLAETQQGYANLCRLLTAARLDRMPPNAQAAATLDDFDPAAPVSDWPGKVTPLLTWERLAQHTQGIIALTGCARGPLAAPLRAGRSDLADTVALALLDCFGRDSLFVELQHHGRPGDDLLVRRLRSLAQRVGLPLVATNNVHYAERAGARLRDALLAIDENVTLTEARRAGLLPATSMAWLAGAEEMAQRFRSVPEAIANTLLIADRCQASLDFSHHRLPAFLDASSPITEFEKLYELCHGALAHRYPELRPVVLKQLAHELEIIERAGLAGYFLIVWDIVRYARERGVRCQGRGSAANSIVAYLLGITSIDPIKHNLLFERFLSADKFTTPDIDVDFAADRREEVIRYVYQRYGRAHAAMVCNVVTYRARSALRDLGKVLDFPEAVVERLAAQLETNSPSAAAAQIEAQLDAQAGEGDAGAGDAHPLRVLAELMRGLEECPRHLSIHSGGMLITGPPLDEIVPLEPATMAGRVICQWNKDSCEDAGLIKIDLLALRTLGVVSEAIETMEAMGESLPAEFHGELDTLPLDDPAIYAMLQRGDTIGAFQVESRAQQQMLPRLKPRRFEDIIIEVAIVRPGPIQGGAVHPYLRRRSGLEPISYLDPSLEPVLGETLGVLLFQEQAIRVSVAAAGFAPGEADMLRRAMSRARSVEAMEAMRGRFVNGALAQGIDKATAEAIFVQLAGFAGFGFCKSHAASFALIAYQTLWLKRYRPVAYYVALFNQQPMGFYPIEVLAGDARRHGVDLLPPDVNRSARLYTPERLEDGRWALRTGLAAVHTLGDGACLRIEAARNGEAARAAGPFADLADFCIRTRLDHERVAALIRAGACDALALPAGDRRGLLWRLGAIDYRPTELPLPQEAADAPLPALPDLSPLEETAWEYELLGLSPDGQILRHYRAPLRERRIAAGWEVKQMEPGRTVRTAGMMAVRQRPYTAKGIVFISLEDESGLLDLVVKPDIYLRYREVLRGSMLLYIEGVVQRSGLAVSVLVRHAAPLLDVLAAPDEPAAPAPPVEKASRKAQRAFF